MWSTITFVGYSERYAQLNMQKLPYLDRPALAVLNIQCTLPAATPSLPMLRRALPFLQRRITAAALPPATFKEPINAAKLSA